MVVKIDTEKVMTFLKEHKEPIIVGAVAILMTRKYRRQIVTLESFISYKSLMDEYCEFIC